MKVLVTGATGFIGHALVEALLEQKASVRCLVRARSRASALEGRGATFVEGALEDARRLDEAVRGVDVVVHLAGVVRAWTRSEYFEVNESGTRRLVVAARDAGATRFVLVSSLAAAGPGTAESPVTEESPDRPIDAYGESKLAGERALADAASGLPWVVVRPSAVYGPRDRDFLTLFRLARRRVVPYVAASRSRLSLLHVADLVELLIRALEPAVPQGVYLASDGLAHSWSEIAKVAARAVGKKVVTFRIPWVLLLPAAHLVGILFSSRLSRPPILCVDKLRESSRSWVASARKAERILGWRRGVPLEEGMRLTAEGYQAAGWLPRVDAP